MFAVLSMYFVVELQVSLFIIHLEEPTFRVEVKEKQECGKMSDECGLAIISG